MTLHEFLALPHRFRWGGVGGDDCTTFCATWIAESIGIDPAEDLRGTYRTQEGAQAILDGAGGIVALIEGRLPAGYVRTEAPVDGDIGVVRLPVAEGDIKEIGAIRFGPLWLVLAPAGVAAKKADFVAAWRFAE